MNTRPDHSEPSIEQRYRDFGLQQQLALATTSNEHALESAGIVTSQIESRHLSRASEDPVGSVPADEAMTRFAKSRQPVGAGGHYQHVSVL